MAAVAAARSVSRLSPLRKVAANLSDCVKPAACRTPNRLLPKGIPSPLPASRFLRSPVELSSCVESLLPMHSVTASAIMISKLSLSRQGCGWLTEGQDETR